MKTYHLNCGTMRPWGVFPISTIPLFGTGALFRRGLAVIHCLLVDTGDGLILVDTGYGTQDITHPTTIVRLFNKVVGLVNDINETALHQVQALGYTASDVKHILLTHMHLDHSGGLPDFPDAQVHVYDVELDMALSGTGFISRFYIDTHRAHGPRWQVHTLQGDTWCGLPCTPAVNLNGVEAFFVPLTGHSPGNCLVVLHLPDGRWLINAGDTYSYHGQVDPDHLFYPPYHHFFRPVFMISGVTRSMFSHEDALRHIRQELGDSLTIFSAHDPYPYVQLSGDDIIAHYFG